MDKDLMIDLNDIVIHRDERNILSISAQIPRQGITAAVSYTHLRAHETLS
jgi:hypothetical protein